MQFPESWLRAFCNPALSTQALADTLTMAGLEVEALQPVAPPFAKVVVGEIKEAVQHPDADRLRVCQVDVGQGALLNIVCGAPNARVGIKVPCALVGAELPPGADGKPFKIKLGKLRGVESQGMLCSARELHVSEDSDGLLELPADTAVGADIRQVLNLDDTLFTLKLTPNLAHGLSVYGVAREVAALTGAPLLAPASAAIAPSTDARLAVKVEAPELCGRFSGRVIRNVDTRVKSPAWLVERLARCGQRSVSPLVDISNYVMFEYGQPSHIFDLDKIEGGLHVRWGRAGESLKLLNGSTITLDEKVGVIADAHQVESLAGIMGGDATAVSDDTRHIYVEAAFWWPEAVQGRSRRFNFSTDAGHRYERGVDPSRTVAIIERISQLVVEICGTSDTQLGPVDDQTLGLPESRPVRLRVARAAKVIGMPVSQDQCIAVLQRLELRADVVEAGVLDVTPPPYRFDVQIEEDLIEEVARLIGYNQLPTTPPLAPITAQRRDEDRRSRFAVRHALADLGYQETINFSFVEERWERELAGNANPIRLLNPIASPMSVMRSSLIGSLLQVLKFNLDRKAPRVRVFEIGRVFERDASVETSDTTVRGIRQPLRVAGLAYGDVDGTSWTHKDSRADFFDAKGDVEALLAPLQATFETFEHPAMHPGRCARVLLDGQAIGVVGELHPRWRQQYDLPQAPVLFELALDAVLQRPVPVAKPVARFQAVERDIAFTAPESLSYATLEAVIRAAAQGSGLLRGVQLFDVYRPQAGKGETGTALASDGKSLAVRLTLASDDGTLSDTQVDPVIQAVVAACEQQLPVKLRA
ncbi:MAG: Phenylalanine--tRNA ligase beta subunit [Paracidovorax wautersii]|uniref:Phenylalanine--tRNA ligase beta subunit n=1 Tax=Paracidovorax wautersii TaxID=1177982 RepID=A0A7V8JNY0_9BURK|nr:MAG: Phenylalanine--tRNA ligase beta subunit [Paracidovorax wautersii]